MTGQRRGRHTETRDERHVLFLVPRQPALGGNGSASWHAAVLRREGSNTFSIAGERDASAADSAAMATWLATWNPAKALVVLPAAASICRTCPLPNAQGEQLASALRLQAETVLLGGNPGLRVAMSALPAHSDRADTRQGVVFAWPEQNSIPALPALPEGMEVFYVPLAATILALLGGEPPERPLVRADRRDGSVLFVVSSHDGLVIRSTREDPSDESYWRDGLARAAAETLLATDRGAEEIRALQAELTRATTSETLLLLPDAARGRFERCIAGGRTGDPERDAERAILAGAALLLDGPLASLAAIRLTKQSTETHPLEQVANRYSNPHRAAIVVGIGVAVLLFAPLLASGIRWSILRFKLPNAAQYERLNRITQQKIEVYKELADATWPVTKLLGDIANSLPEGIEPETIQLSTGDGLTLRGMARGTSTKDADGKPVSRTALEVIILAEKKLRDTGIFNNIDYKADPPQVGGYRSFTLTAKVTKPSATVKWAEADDFGLPGKDLRSRKYPDWQKVEGANGALASSDSAESASPDEPAPPSGSRAARNGGSGSNGSHGSSRSAPPAPPAPPPGAEAHGATPGEPAKPDDKALADGSKPADGAAMPDRGIGRRHPGESGEAKPGESKPGEAKPGENRPAQPSSAGSNVEIPGPFTDDEIKALSKAEAQALLGKISRARQLPGLDAETQDRLKADFQRVLNQAKSAT